MADDAPDPAAPLDLDGMVAVVTGGASGIGKAIARALLGRGTTVVIADIEAASSPADFNPSSSWVLA